MKQNLSGCKKFSNQEKVQFKAIFFKNQINARSTMNKKIKMLNDGHYFEDQVKYCPMGAREQFRSSECGNIQGGLTLTSERQETGRRK